MGSRIALRVGISTIGIALCIGIALGLIAGYGPRWLDNLLMLVFNSVYSFPTVIMGLTVATLLGPSIATLMFVVIVVQTPAYARLDPNRHPVAQELGICPGDPLARRLALAHHRRSYSAQCRWALADHRQHGHSLGRGARGRVSLISAWAFRRRRRAGGASFRKATI